MFIATGRRWESRFALMLASTARAAGVPDDCTQLIVGIAPDWNSMRGHLQLFERIREGDWSPVGQSFPFSLARSGLAWGSGLAGQDENGLRKDERDGRAPAGIFRIGKIYTYDAQLPPGSDYPFHQVTTADAWIDDVTSPDYNRFVTIPDPANPPPWFAKAKMRHNDFAYRWLVEIRHNSDPPCPARGAPFFSIFAAASIDRPPGAPRWRSRIGANDHLAAGTATSLLCAPARYGLRR